MGVKNSMNSFFAAMGGNLTSNNGYGSKIVSTPWGPFTWNDDLNVWVNINNGLQLNNISFQDMYAMIDYNTISSDNQEPAVILIPAIFDFTSGSLSSNMIFYRNSIGTFVNSSGYLEYSKDNLLPNTVFAGVVNGTNTVPTGWGGASNLGNNTFSLNNKQLTLSINVSANIFFIYYSAPVIPGVPYTTSITVNNSNLTATNGKSVSNLIGWSAGQLSGTGVYRVNGNIVSSTYSSWNNGDTISYTVTPDSTTTTAIIRIGTSVSGVNASNLNDFITISQPQFEAGSSARTYIENPNTYSYYGPRFTYESSTKQALGLWIEGSATNFAPSSSDLTQIWGNGSDVAVVAGNSADPFGGTAAFKIYATTRSAVKSRNSAFTMSNYGSCGSVPFTFSIFARPNNYSKLCLSDPSNGWAGATFDLITGSASMLSGSPTTSNFNSFGSTAYTIPFIGTNGITWWRCIMAVSRGNDTTTMGLGFGGYTSEASIFGKYGASYSGTNQLNDGIFVFGPQFEVGYGASSYMPTGITGNAAGTLGITRESDAMQIKTFPYTLGTANNTLYLEGKFYKATVSQISYDTIYGLWSDSNSSSSFDILTYPINPKMAGRVRGITLDSGGSEEPGISQNIINSYIKMATTMTVGATQISYFALNGSSASATHNTLTDVAYAPSRMVFGHPVGNSGALPYTPSIDQYNASYTIAVAKYWNYALGNTAAFQLTL
jgi:hypothetical protein